MRPPAFLVSIAWLATAGDALGCPRCEPGLIARQQVMQNLFPTLLIALIPFVAIALATLVAERLGERSFHDR